MIEIQVQGDKAERHLAALVGQLPFATSLAINNTAKDFQKRQREHMMRVFTVRRPAWVRQAVKIKPFSTKYRLEAKVSIDAPGGRSDILARHERRYVKTPRGRSLAVPEDVRTSERQVVPKSKRPKSFEFRLTGIGRGGVGVYQGKQRTFMIQRSDGTGGIYQRTGRKGSKRRKGAGRAMVSDIASRRTRDANVRVLYRFTPHVAVEERLDFVFIGKKVVRDRFGPNWTTAMERAMSTSGRSPRSSVSSGMRLPRVPGF